MIPDEKIMEVFQGLEEAFGASAIDDIRRLDSAAGSDLNYRIVVNGSPYLLRVVMQADERMDPARIFTCMRAAGEGGVGPLVRYSSIGDGISITDFVEDKPLMISQALVLLPAVLRKLHALPPFPKVFNFVTAHNGFVWKLRKAGLLPQAATEEVFQRYEQVCAVYPCREEDMVPCHMDLKPENLRFDGERLWLVDWRAGFDNDRYFDLASAANFLVAGDSDEAAYLAAYFGESPDEYRRARFFLMRQVVHMLAAAIYLILGAAGKPIGQTPNSPAFAEFHRRLWAGEIGLSDNRQKVAYGLLHWEELARNVRARRFEEAIAIVSAGNEDADGGARLLPAAPVE